MNISDSVPALETRRLVLRVPTSADAAAMARFAADNREHFAAWDPLRIDEYFTVRNWAELIREGMKRAADGSGLQFALFPKGGSAGEIIGQCTFSGIVRGPFQAAYLGYGLDYREVGKGLMREALVAALQYCFDVLNLHRIMANYMPANVRSGGLLERLGFVPEGYARDYLFIAGQWQDHILTSLTNRQWKPV
ncbi:MAG TPA: GNAT family N-acetyltransferase [Gammaproteobacteria bacterium]|nr:GNAT family N-acetyltransferase [Gammaproteobacteria bacterium]